MYETIEIKIKTDLITLLKILDLYLENRIKDFLHKHYFTINLLSIMSEYILTTHI